MLKQYKLRNYHFLLILYMMILTIIGIVVIGSAEEAVQNKQIMGFAIGIVCMVILSLMDYSVILKLEWFYYAISLLLLLWVEIAGVNSGGSQRWIKIGFQFQPSEIVKIFLILFLAYFFAKHQENLNRMKTLLFSIVLVGVPSFLILKQPDLSTTIVTIMIFVMMLFIAGLSYRYILSFLAVVIPAAIFTISYVLTSAAKATSIEDVDYHLIRILAWLYPDNPLWAGNAAQQKNSIMAIGSGQLWGKGIDNADATSLLNGNWISEAQTDFIFAVVGEEMGFVGSILIVVLLLLIVIECVLIARKAKDLAGRLICCGMATLVGIQSFVNIGVATGLLPNTGIPLPFVSYGLTSLVSLYIGMGFVLNVGLQPKSSFKGDIE